MQTDFIHIQTPLGIAKIVYEAGGISSITVSDDKTIPLTDAIPKPYETCVQQLHEYFNGERKVFDFPIAPKGTDFQQRVWKALQDIPFGKTISYLALSKTLGDVKAIRAVASANGKNPLWIVVPCHRVIGSDGSLTGYAGGLWRKKWLIAHESPVKQQSLF